MSNLFTIPGVSNIDEESATGVSGGALTLSSGRNNTGTRITRTRADNSLGRFNNRASWYRVTGNRDWLVYANTNFRNEPRRLRAGTSGNLTGFFDNDVESVRPV
jgi:hypothetical protein